VPQLYALLTFAMTVAGGAFAIRFRKHLDYVIAFSAGFLPAIVFLDLIPEIVEQCHRQGQSVRMVLGVLLIGFSSIFLLEKLTIIHAERDHDAPDHRHYVGIIGAIGLAFHSFLDGMAIGVAFQLGSHVGWLVLFAVIAHDFADGINTVTLMLTNQNPVSRTIVLLLLDAATPVIGASVAMSLHPNPRILTFQLAFFAGFLLYLGASDLLPQVHLQPRIKLVASTFVGMGAAIIAVLLTS
jgi:zinc transporter ZupT